MNIIRYVTNAPAHILSTEIIHEIYSLRWQVEIMFKIWKSIFQIHLSKPVKIERFNCHLYGKFIAVLLSTVVVFTYRDDVYYEYSKQLSEYKAFSIVKSMLFNIKQAFFNNEITLLNLFQLIN
ncbi:transposase [Clostridium sp. JS66]|uniref:transposase n=1 Tax=Clostridium sp. JS66 TaxID=3064705 RepID=UPI00298D8005|nr:transposase [Clostridium sp. JS66]WPC42709.1 transposase [Clostridium sp. JS66]